MSNHVYKTIELTGSSLISPGTPGVGYEVSMVKLPRLFRRRFSMPRLGVRSRFWHKPFSPITCMYSSAFDLIKPSPRLYATRSLIQRVE